MEEAPGDWRKNGLLQVSTRCCRRFSSSEYWEWYWPMARASESSCSRNQSRHYFWRPFARWKSFKSERFVPGVGWEPAPAK